MTSLLGLFLLGIGVALSAVQHQHLSNHDDMWQHWKDRHSKVYNDSKESDLRRGHWENNLAMIQEHNVRHQLGLNTYSMGLNHFSDLTWDEVKQIYLSGIIEPKTEAVSDLPVRWVTAADAEGAPPDLDWREHGMVSPVKDQQLVDCSQEFRNNGCYGGWQTNCYRYINKYGIESDRDYPYVEYQQRCAQNPQLSILNVTGMARSTIYDEVALLALVSRYGPAAVVVNADQGFVNYESGIYLSDTCYPQYMTHAVLVVGYGTEDGQDFWTMKNSQGADWGDKGYIKIGRNYGNMCGVASEASVPLI